MTYIRAAACIAEFQMKLWEEVREILRFRCNDLLSYTRMRFLSHKSGISVGIKSGRLAGSGSVREPYRRGLKIFAGIKYNARDPKTGYNYAFSHFRNPGKSSMVVIVPRNKRALAIPIEGAGSTYGGNTFARAGMLFVRNSFDPYDFTPVAILKQKVTYPRRIDVENHLLAYINPKIEADIAAVVNRYRCKQ
jgi:hypothetical protein